MKRLVVRAALLGCLAMATAQAPAQRLYCTLPEVLHHPDGTPVFLGQDCSRLTHFAVGNAERPRLIYKRRRPGTDRGHELVLLEGGAPQTFNTTDDVAATLPMSAFAGYTAPWIDDFEVSGKWLVLAVSDARTASSPLTRAPAQVLLVELAPRAEVAAVHVLGSYWGDGRAQWPRIRDVRIDREPAPDAAGPIVSWCVTYDSWQSGTRDDIYYVRIGSEGPLSAPMQALIAAPSWSRVENFTATEAGGRHPTPAFLISATTVGALGADTGIFAALAQRGAPSPWLDRPGCEQIVERFGQHVFYYAPGRLGGPRLHAAIERPGDAPLSEWSGDLLTGGEDAAFSLARATGYTRATWPDGMPAFTYGMFERRSGENCTRPPGRPGRDDPFAEVQLFAVGFAPQSLRSLTGYPENLCTHAQCVSRNLCIVTVLPRQESAGFPYEMFVDRAGDPIAVFFHCGF